MSFKDLHPSLSLRREKTEPLLPRNFAAGLSVVQMISLVLLLILAVIPRSKPVSAQAPCPPEDCTPGRDVGRDFFVQVLERLADVPVSDFAVEALMLWEPHENTSACWNPLATTWDIEGCCNFNAAGVKHYLDQDMGTQATAKTLALPYYENIRRMLRLEEFDREGLRADLGTWGTCSGQGCNSLLDKWEALWNDRGAAADVYLLVDLSGSFYDDLPHFKTQAPGIVSTLTASNPNTRFGIGKFEDYPIPPFGYGYAGDKAYERLVDLTFDTDLVLNAISGLFTRYGGDGPQSQLPALYQAATGAGQDLSGAGWPSASIPPDQQANFRDGATKLFLLWTDAPFHHPGDPGSIPYPGPSFDETVNAIRALDPPKVIGVSSGPDGIPDLEAIAAATDALAPLDGVDCDGDGVIDIAEGEPLVCGIASSGVGIGEAVVALVEAATGPTIVDIDIKPGSDPNSINCNNENGAIAVAILTTADFDATTVNHTIVTFEGATEMHVDKKSGEPRRHEEDVDGDGDIDLVFHFRLGDTELTCESTEGTLVGETFDGQPIQGTDAVRMIDRGGGKP